LVSNNRTVASAVLIGLAIPVLLLGVIVQRAALGQSEASWNQQRAFWNQLFTVAPDLEPKTTVLLVVQQPRREGGALPFESAEWGFTSALATLYGRNDLVGFFMYQGDNLFDYQSDGVSYRIGPAAGNRKPYDTVLLFNFDPSKGTLENVPTVLTDEGIERSLCSTCVGSTERSDIPLRRLVSAS
jgi:hypothetical protein